jgi:glutamate N-acetyltransferase / amino-acid N-acetyltransferase
MFSGEGWMKDNVKPVVPGFLANGIHSGIKEAPKKDLSLIYSQVPAVAAGVFTTNDFKAAPVLLSQERIRGGIIQAVIANSGNANAATGEQGCRDALAMSRAVAKGIGVSPTRVLVASTGKIGEPLPIEKIESGIPMLISGLGADRILEAEEGIMTTDKFPKIELRKRIIDSREITVCGIAKGACMIEPKMATMLSFTMTDVAIGREALDVLFRQVVAQSFNAVSVDGCMSTNDTSVILANGFAENEPLCPGTVQYQDFKDMLLDVMLELSKAIVRDGEGATKVIEVVVEGAKNAKDAENVAYAVARSNLVKTAFFGMDPNWGRIISAAGSIGLCIPNDKMEVYLEEVPIFRDGSGTKADQQALLEIMRRNTIKVTMRLAMGDASFRLFTSDLSHEYIHINADYHT